MLIKFVTGTKKWLAMVAAQAGLEGKTGHAYCSAFRRLTLHFPEALVATDRQRKRVVILGAAGRDFHNFNVCFRNAPDFQVVAFTAAQIPGIESRRYPPSLSGSLYPDGIPIYAEEKLEELIRTELFAGAGSLLRDVASDIARACPVFNCDLLSSGLLGITYSAL